MRTVRLSVVFAAAVTLTLAGCASTQKSHSTSMPAASQPASQPASQSHEGAHHGGHAEAGHHEGGTAPMAFDAPPAVGTKAMCPVSKEVFTVEADTKRATYNGKHYAFCCEKCAKKFAANPEKFAAGH